MVEGLIAAVVLAAGASSRMGRPKQTISLQGVPMLEMVLESFRRSRVGRVVVVLGANAAEVRKRIKIAHEVVVVNEAFSEGMSSSLRLGLEHTGEAEAAIIALGDQPFVLPGTINRMVAAYDESRARIVIPTYRGARGNPVLFDRSVFPQIKRIRGDSGARAVVQKNAEQVLEVEVPDRGVLIDIDTPSDLDRESKVRRRRSRARA
jgi:molybdenum cofactor cytidylyltransferase